MDYQFYLMYAPTALFLIALGIMSVKYLRNNKLDSPTKLGLNTYWLKLYGYVSIILGSGALIAILFALYYELKYLDYI